MNFSDHKNLGNHLLQLCPKVVKHPVFGGGGLTVASSTFCLIPRWRLRQQVSQQRWYVSTKAHGVTALQTRNLHLTSKSRFLRHTFLFSDACSRRCTENCHCLTASYILLSRRKTDKIWLQILPIDDTSTCHLTEHFQSPETDLRCMYVGHLESKERLSIQPAQLFNFSWWVMWCVQ